MKFNIGDVVKGMTENDAYWIILDIDNTNYSMKPINNIEHVIVMMAIITIDRFCECC